MKNIIFIAPIASGKGKIAEGLIEKYGYAHVSIGQLLRDNRDRNDEIGKHIVECQDKGVLVDDTITVTILKERLAQPDCAKGYILDGFPRSVEQAGLYDQLLKELNYDLGIVVNLDIPKAELLNRTIGRSICPNCKADYNDFYEPAMPKVKGICDKCGTALIKRSDDSEEVFNVRYNVFLTQTKPLLEYYQARGNVYSFNSLSSVENYEGIVKVLEELND